MAEQKKFNTDIAILKFLFSLVIVWYHFQRVSPHYPYLLPKGYLCVELFLLISGYFMASSIVRNQAKGIEQNAFEFTLHKIKFIYPHLFVAFIISFILQNIFLIDMPLKDFFTLGIFSLGELSFIQIVGLKTSTHLPYNAQIWYVNAMIVAIFFLYPFVKKNVTKYGCYWGVLLPLFLYSYYITISQDILGRVYPWFRFATGGIILALSGLSLGISLYVASEAIKKKYDITKLGNIVLRSIAFLTLALLFIFIKTAYFSQFKVVTDLNFVAYSFIFLLLILITKPQLNIISIKVAKFLSDMSLPIYLNHFIILYLVKAYASGISDNKKFIIYMIASLITPIITLPLAKLVSKGFTKLHTICFNKNTIKA